MESHVHSTLKRLSAAFLAREGYLAVGMEVRCPGSRYRVDVAGWLDRIPWPREQDESGRATLWSTVASSKRDARDRRCEPRTIIIECKQSRADFIRDDRHAEGLVAMREEAEHWKRRLEEERIKTCEPELRETESALFPGLETWNFAGSRLGSYRRLLRRIRRIEAQLYGETKFCLMARHRLADRLFIAAPRGLIRPRETPSGWGLLEFPRASFDDPGPLATPLASVHPVEHASKPESRARLLRNIAVAGTRAIRRGLATTTS